MYIDASWRTWTDGVEDGWRGRFSHLVTMRISTREQATDVVGEEGDGCCIKGEVERETHEGHDD